MSDDRVVLFLAGEDRQHRQVCAGLADRVFRASIDWLDGVDLDHVRRWQGRSAEEAYYKHKDARDDAAKLGFRAHGFIDGKPAGPEAQWLRCILAVARAAGPHAAVVARDLDGNPGRRESFDTVMRSFPPSFPVVYAGPEPEIEAWIVAGYEASTPDEKAQLDALSGELGFSPTTSPERMTSTARAHKGDAKAVCRQLTGADEAREARCLDDLRRLREHGEGCRLKAYLEDVDRELVPVVRAPVRTRET